MKQTIHFPKLIILYIIFFMIFGCEKQNTTKKCSFEYSPPVVGQSLDCFVSSFMEGVSMYSNYCNTYVIEGIVLDKIEYGLKIRLIEDLKGNFPENVDIFIAWGREEKEILLSDRMEILSFYDKQDTLIMHLTPARDLSEMTPPQYTWFEKPEDYTTLTCTFSVLKVSGDYVEGCILSPNDGIHNYINSTMLLKDFNEKLKRALHIYQINR